MAQLGTKTESLFPRKGNKTTLTVVAAAFRGVRYKMNLAMEELKEQWRVEKAALQLADAQRDIREVRQNYCTYSRMAAAVFTIIPVNKKIVRNHFGPALPALLLLFSLKSMFLVHKISQVAYNYSRYFRRQSRGIISANIGTVIHISPPGG